MSLSREELEQKINPSKANPDVFFKEVANEAEALELVDKALEAEIGRAEGEAAAMEETLALPETWRDPEKAAALNREYQALKQRIDTLYDRMAEAEEEAE